jgi:hypothetical protein
MGIKLGKLKARTGVKLRKYKARWSKKRPAIGAV